MRRGDVEPLDGDLDMTLAVEEMIDGIAVPARDDRRGRTKRDEALSELRAGLPDEDVLGPAPLLRLRGRYRAQLVAKTDRPRRIAAQAGRLLSSAAPAMRRAGLTAVVDVDPQSM